jgi:hypothetical protein
MVHTGIGGGGNPVTLLVGSGIRSSGLEDPTVVVHCFTVVPAADNRNPDFFFVAWSVSNGKVYHHHFLQ